MTKFKNRPRTFFSLVLPPLVEKYRMTISEMISAQYLQKVWAVLKKKLP